MTVSMTNNTLLIIFNSSELLGRFLLFIIKANRKFVFPLVIFRISYLITMLLIAEASYKGINIVIIIFLTLRTFSKWI